MYKCRQCGGHEFYIYKDKRWGDGIARTCKVCFRETKRRYYARLKDDVLTHYGKTCRCCGEKNPRFLCIDHMNGGGNRHRKQIGGGGLNLYIWLKSSGWPRGFQVLCFNCNQAKYIYGICPHQTLVDD